MLNDEYVHLIDSMPQTELDSAIVQAARVSYMNSGSKSQRSEEGLIRYLMRHNHTTPFEMVEFKFYLKMPIFLARQHFRHRTASINEISARYSVVNPEFFVPDQYRSQSTVNKQSSEEPVDIDNEPQRSSCKTAFAVYNTLLSQGCSRELARCHLPQSTYTEFIWKINLHNLMHYLQLRMAPDAQKEIRDYAVAIFKRVEGLIPLTMKAFMDFRVNSVTLTGPEVECLRTGVPISNASENREFEDKKKLLGIIPVQI
jgi:thymidylate synthase (FAD)